MKRVVILAGTILFLGCVGAQAQEDIGKNEYAAACAVCHGESGKGNGPFSRLMNISVPSLTTLSSQNEGNFPFLEVFMTVDGRTQVEGHGSPMPVWGERFSVAAADDYGPYGSELMVRGRILSLVTYVESIQE
ncbi:cytochrome c [Loktanella sp. PT4BL]|uniref:c-type cytochrome n=1 Tax=Loktanella sp. PT4BL TaxID=2135611 RepID=UPI000D86BD72|nr:c-type cytochrome [Loktanella sp. PT4BL]PXW68058.1 cytochrome c [Loktanella sp. PT4BL]